MHPRDKIIGSIEKLAQICRRIRETEEVIVLTSGCFDLLHGGHLEYVCDAGEMGFLVVGINSDKFVKKLKGDSRPIRDQDDRAFTMAGFFPVGLVAVYDCDYELIEAVRPNVYVASTTSVRRVWDDARRVSILEGMGSQIVEFDSKKTDSTSDIIRRATAR
jgi:D-glycero-beta-D-manno-heptose 1-phosphate adenylyltransferase